MPDSSLTLRQLANAAFRQAASKVVRKAKEHGTPVVLWDDAAGTVRYVSPEECEELDRVANAVEHEAANGTDFPKPNTVPPG